MTEWHNTAEGQPTGTVATAANSGGASGDPFSSFSSAGALQFLDAAAVHQSRGYRVVPQSGVIREARVDIAAAAAVHFVGYFIRRADPTATHTILQLRSASALIAQLQISASNPGRINVQNAAASTIFGTVDSNTVIDTIYRIELKVEKGTGTGDGKCEFRLYVGDSTTPQATFSSTTVNMGTADFTNMRIGRPSASTTDVTTEDWDSLRLFTDADLPGTMSNPEPAPSYDPIVMGTPSQTGPSTVSVSWTHPADAPYGVSIVRAPGDHVVSDPEDPLAVSGATVLTTGETSSPYLDEGVTPGWYTYWAQRTEAP